MLAIYLTEGSTTNSTGAKIFYDGSVNTFNIGTGNSTTFTNALTIERDTQNVSIPNGDLIVPANVKIGNLYLNQDGVGDAFIYFYDESSSVYKTLYYDKYDSGSLPSETHFTFDDDLKVEGKLHITDSLTAPQIFGTSIADNTVPSVDVVKLDGYGLIGNRANVYITNAESTGMVQIGIGDGHNSHPKLNIYGTNVESTVPFSSKTSLLTSDTGTSTYTYGTTEINGQIYIKAARGNRGFDIITQQVGAGDDFDGTLLNSYYTNTGDATQLGLATGNVVRYMIDDNGNHDFKTGTVTVGGQITANGGSWHPDDKIANFGNGGDFNIFHGADKNIIASQDANNRTIYIGLIESGTTTLTGTMASFIPNGAANLYYNNSLKLETTTTGISVSGGIVGNKINTSGALGADFAGSFENTSDNGHGILIKGGGTDGVRYIIWGQDYLGNTKFTVDDAGSISATEAILGSGDRLKFGTGESYVQGSTVSNNVILGTSGTTRYTIDSSGNHDFESGTVNFGNTLTATKGIFTNLTTGYVPYHVNDSDGLANSPLTISGDGVTATVYNSNFVIQGSDDGSGQLILRGNADAANYWEVGRESAARGEYMIREWLNSAWITTPRFLIARSTGNAAIGYLATDTAATGNKLAVNGSGYFSGALTAASYSDNTPHYDGNALAELSLVSGTNGEIDHNTLPTFAQTKFKKNKITLGEKIIVSKLDAFEEVVEDIEVEVSSITETYFEIINEKVVEKTKEIPVKEKRKKSKKRLIDGVKLDSITGELYIQEEIMEEVETGKVGRDLGAMISILTTAVQQLTTQNKELLLRVEELENK